MEQYLVNSAFVPAKAHGLRLNKYALSFNIPLPTMSGPVSLEIPMVVQQHTIIKLNITSQIHGEEQSHELELSNTEHTCTLKFNAEVDGKYFLNFKSSKQVAVNRIKIIAPHIEL